MARIRTYALDDNVTGSDYWIGTDGNNNSNTKNFSPNSVAKYLNENEVVDVSNSIRFRYDTIDSGKPRMEGTLSFATEIGAVVPINSLTTFILSKNTQSTKLVSAFLNILPGTKIILQKSDYINIFGIFKVISVTQIQLEPDFYTVVVQYISGYGSLEEDKDYIISLIDTREEQNLQQVTDEGATTTNGITITVGDGGANGITSFSSQGYGVRGESSETSGVYGTSTSGAGVYGFSGSEGVIGEGSTGVKGIGYYGVDGNSYDGVGVFAQTGIGIGVSTIAENEGTAIYAYSTSGKGIEVNGNGTIAINVNLGNSNKGLVINSGTSSTGNPIVIDKNGVEKLVVNQQGELTATKLIKQGGTGTNVLLDNGNTVALSSIGGNQNLQQVTDLGATTDNTIIVSVAGANPAITGYSSTGNGIYGQSDGKGVYGYSFLDAAVYGYAESVTGIAIKGYAEDGVAAEFETDAFSANIANFKKSGVLKAFINNAGELTAQKLIKDGGTSSQILAADGSVITAGTNITITGGQISSVGGSGGRGSTVNYYLNGGTSQGAFGGTTYYEFSKTAVIGTGADFSRGSNGYIASFITDVADPSLLLIPGGNWNLEFFFSASSNGGSPSFYVELYKYNGTTFTIIASSSATPEGITNGTSIDAYFTALAVPETVLTVNDRLAIRVFVNASSKTITLHTQNGHLCEVITTFTAGLTALNGLQAQVQNFATETTGTDFAIVSSGSTHTFNLPSASSTARGLVSIGTQTFAGQKTFESTPIAPTPAAFNDSALLATTEYVDRQIGLGGPAYNILIGSGTGMGNITTETTGTSGGTSYPQNGRNVMINNGATAITVAATVADTATDFIASYTKVGTATITFTFTGTGFVFITPNGAVLSGNVGSTALLTKNGSTVYLLINNIF